MADDKQVKKVEQAKELLTDVAERVKGSGTQVYEKLRDTLVDREVGERVVLLEKALVQRNQTISELRKLEKPDVETFDADGKVLSASWSKQRTEELKKKREQLQRLETAFDNALGDNDFQ
ncbi:MAG: hypothetical protein Q7K43_00805, partial [Candidatus Woesearchaeota archaeon]|nr:hypothetical protein [Candidatus Woesearchaeota archaeon]